MDGMRASIWAVCLVLFSCDSASQKACEPLSYGVSGLDDGEPIVSLDAIGPCETSFFNGSLPRLRGTGEGSCRVDAKTESGRSARVEVTFASAAGGCGFAITGITDGTAELREPPDGLSVPGLKIEFPCGCRGNKAPEICTACNPVNDESCVCTTATSDPRYVDLYDCYGVGGGQPVWRLNSQVCIDVDGDPDGGRGQ